MDLTFSNEDRAFQRGVRDWFAANTPEALRRKVQCGQMLTRDDVVHWQLRLDEQGYLVVGWPKEHGGPGWTPTQRHLYDLERAAANAPVGLSMGVIMLGPVLIAFGTEAQKAQYLPRIRRCEDWWCQGYSEPGAGSDLASLATTAVADGDDYVINGSKIWTTYAHWATHMFCLVRTASTGKKQEGISCLLIEMGRPGIEVGPIVSIDGEHHLNQVFFTDLRVPRSNLVGKQGQGCEIAKFLLTHERTSIAGVADSKAAMANLLHAAAGRGRRARLGWRPPDRAAGHVGTAGARRDRPYGARVHQPARAVGHRRRQGARPRVVAAHANGHGRAADVAGTGARDWRRTGLALAPRRRPGRVAACPRDGALRLPARLHDLWRQRRGAEDGADQVHAGGRSTLNG